ncbi:MAG: outer membrane protein transport protein [Deltaproteobacteria bacterium]|nr:outer membrane protein transport protein [Deltaproteobacteria bacterium]
MMNYCKALRTITIIFVAGCMICFSSQPTPVWAGGLYLEEFGTPSMGVASAGAEAVAADASASWHNPAGMTRLDGKQLMVAGGLVYSKAKFDQKPGNIVSGGDGGDAGGLAPMGGAFYTHSLSEDLKFGLSLFSISAALLDYDNGWVGRYQCQEVSIFTMTMNPSIAYQVNDWLSIGGGPAIVYGDLDLKVAAPPPDGNGRVEIDGDDWEVGFDAGVLFEPSERTRFGLLYFSGWDLEFGGDLNIKGTGINAGTDTELKYPQMVRLGAYHEINDRLALLGTVAWEEWS